MPKCERALICEFFKPHPLICMLNLQVKQERPVAADVQDRVEAALVVLWLCLLCKLCPR